MGHQRISVASLIGGWLSVAAAVILPIVLWQLKLPIIAQTYNGQVPGMLNSQPFELFGLLISIFLAIVTWLNIQKLETKTLETLTPVVLPLLVSLQILFFLLEDSHPKSGDYLCYENAAQAVVSGLNPYTVYLKCYLYPPLQAQVLAALYQGVSNILLFTPGDSQKAWIIVFYFYQCAQFLQILLAYYLTYKLAQKMGLAVIPASLIVSALFLFNNPLVRTIKFNQVNVWILNCFLLAILLVPRRPFWAGLAVALGAHIKLYTLALLLPWTLTKRWLAAISVASGFGGILLLQTGWGSNLTLWQQFLDYFTQRVEKPSNYRNSGIWSFVYNTAKIPAEFTQGDYFSLVPLIVMFLNLAMVVWFTWRILQRQKLYAELGVDMVNPNPLGDRYLQYAHGIDAVALGLLISPSVWEHHYVLAIPVALWAIVIQQSKQPWLVGLGVFLIFCLPTFDVFPLAHHRMLGLLILIYATSPRFLYPLFRSARSAPETGAENLATN